MEHPSPRNQNKGFLSLHRKLVARPITRGGWLLALRKVLDVSREAPSRWVRLHAFSDPGHIRQQANGLVERTRRHSSAFQFLEFLCRDVREVGISLLDLRLRDHGPSPHRSLADPRRPQSSSTPQKKPTDRNWVGALRRLAFARMRRTSFFFKG